MNILTSFSSDWIYSALNTCLDGVVAVWRVCYVGIGWLWSAVNSGWGTGIISGILSGLIVAYIINRKAEFNELQRCAYRDIVFFRHQWYHLAPVPSERIHRGKIAATGGFVPLMPKPFEEAWRLFYGADYKNIADEFTNAGDEYLALAQRRFQHSVGAIPTTDNANPDTVPFTLEQANKYMAIADGVFEDYQAAMLQLVTQLKMPWRKGAKCNVSWEKLREEYRKKEDESHNDELS
tara:strand:- start:103 stop:810 length:708 start_codon:yes stop_codon:yes gene_type:complete